MQEVQEALDLLNAARHRLGTHTTGQVGRARARRTIDLAITELTTLEHWEPEPEGDEKTEAPTKP